MSSTTDEQATVPTVDEMVARWKREQWERLGFKPDDSVLLAEELDWHDVERLMLAGCDRELALRIVR